MRVRPALILTLGSLAIVSACSSDRGLRDIRSQSRGPDEFLVMPAKPLSEPANFSELPPPTPGGNNRTDQNPNADAIAALGGNVRSATAVPSADSTLVRTASRYGVAENTRDQIEQEDEAFRRRQARLSSLRLFPVDRYSQVYRRQSLDPFAENERFRRAGVPTATAPPDE